VNPADLAGGPFRRVLLASEGRPFSAAAVERAALLADPAEGEVLVLAIARVWGTAFGFPNPWLLPSRHELAAQRDSVGGAVQALERRGLRARGRVVGTRDAAKRIVGEARASGHEVIVMGADPPRARWLRGLWWSQEPQRVQVRAQGRAGIPVHLVEG
jgi:hypothetical protein